MIPYYIFLLATFLAYAEAHNVIQGSNHDLVWEQCCIPAPRMKRQCMWDISSTCANVSGSSVPLACIDQSVISGHVPGEKNFAYGQVSTCSQVVASVPGLARVGRNATLIARPFGLTGARAIHSITQNGWTIQYITPPSTMTTICCGTFNVPWDALFYVHGGRPPGSITVPCSVLIDQDPTNLSVNFPLPSNFDNWFLDDQELFHTLIVSNNSGDGQTCVHYTSRGSRTAIRLQSTLFIVAVGLAVLKLLNLFPSPDSTDDESPSPEDPNPSRSQSAIDVEKMDDE